MHRKIKRISAAPGKISVTFDTGETIYSERNKPSTAVVAEILRQEFEDKERTSDNVKKED